MTHWGQAILRSMGMSVRKEDNPLFKYYLAFGNDVKLSGNKSNISYRLGDNHEFSITFSKPQSELDDLLYFTVGIPYDYKKLLYFKIEKTDGSHVIFRLHGAMISGHTTSQFGGHKYTFKYDVKYECQI